jgi:hypothetical protein
MYCVAEGTNTGNNGNYTTGTETLVAQPLACKSPAERPALATVRYQTEYSANNSATDRPTGVMAMRVLDITPVERSSCN